MDRRLFLKILSGATAGFALDPERLLWVPGQKKIFLPSVKVWSVNEIIEAEMARIAPHLSTLFDNDNAFYALLNGPDIIETEPREIPLNQAIKEGLDDDSRSGRNDYKDGKVHPRTSLRIIPGRL